MEKNRLTVNYYVYPCENNYKAYCPSLGLSIVKKDFHSASDSFCDVFTNFVNEHTTNDTLYKTLTDRGWKINTKFMYPPSINQQLKKPEFYKIMNSPIGLVKLNLSIPISDI